MNIIRTYPRFFGAERAEVHGLPREGHYVLADVGRLYGTDHGLPVAGPYETPGDARIAGRMLERGDKPAGGYPIKA